MSALYKILSSFAAGLVFAAAAVSLSPWSRNFPLNDDWIYALPVKNLLAGEGLRLFDVFHTQVFQVAWGWLWTALFGFSFGALRMSTLFFAAAAVWLFARLLLKFEVSPRTAFLGAFCLAFNPLFFSLSMTFMTEVPYLFLVLLSVYWFPHNGEKKFPALWGASLSSAAASLVRPTGILAPAGFSPEILFGREGKLRRLLIIWLPSAAALAGWWLWLNSSDASLLAGSTAGVHSEAFNYWGDYLRFPLQTLRRLCSGIVLYGLFLMPFSAVFAFRPGFFREFGKDRKALLISAAVIILAGFHVLLEGRAPVPGDGNYVYRTGLGYVTIYGFASKSAGLLGKSFFWPLVSALSLFSAGILAAEFSRLKNLPVPVKTCLLVFAFQFGFVLVAPRFFDRYFIYALPGLLLAAAMSARNFSFSVPSAFFAVLLALFSWAGTADYLAWNGAKWEAAGRAPRYGIAAEDVAGGFDYDAWHNYEKRLARLKSAGASHIREWEWADLSSKKAVVVFSPPPRLEESVLEKVEYKTPLSPFGGGAVYLLRL
ncbi:MAG: hypothetical protein COT17_02910 [Elusimicrobia bacterium CG08_land_8_20_14_0_20_51_18]|nr:MAG: hypothetical protein COT17_02910 [Elusimicrobia bacterium CG08_land_8_20_14_0_20_51_18]